MAVFVGLDMSKEEMGKGHQGEHIKLRRSCDCFFPSITLVHFRREPNYTILLYADKRIVNIMKVYIKRNLQLELIR